VDAVAEDRADPTKTSGLFTTVASSDMRMSRRWYCARTVPSMPVLAPRMAADRRASGTSGGRDAQSIAFLSTPGTEWLYSGVAISSASAAWTRRRSSPTTGGKPAASTSSS
jgi:hypothetical protein